MQLHSHRRVDTMGITQIMHGTNKDKTKNNFGITIPTIVRVQISTPNTHKVSETHVRINRNTYRD